jgi:hypothetical protein
MFNRLILRFRQWLRYRPERRYMGGAARRG